MTQQINFETDLAAKYKKRKYWKNRIRGTAIPEDQPIFKKSFQKHIEGSEADSIERGLQNHYQRWGS